MLQNGGLMRLLGVGQLLRETNVPEIDPADARLITELYPTLRRFAAVVAPWGDDPDDVLHSAVLGVLRSRSLAGLEDPGAYLRRAIVNTVRSNHRRRLAGNRALGRTGGQETERDQYPSDVAELLALRPIERAVLYLHDVEGLSFDEVAEWLGIRPGNARVTASRARRRLRDVMEEEGS